MNEQQYKELVEKLGKEAADQIKKEAKAIEDALNAKYSDMTKGMATAEEFSKLKAEQEETLKKINEKLAAAEEVTKQQGIIINTLKESGNGQPKRKTLEDYFESVMPQIKELRGKQIGFFEVTGRQLKDAGITSIGNSIADQATSIGSPYLPGIGGAELELFDIVRNPNFIINHVNVGRTNQFRLAWINEIDYQGTPDANIVEGGAKPLTQHKFQVEFSTAKKAAAYIELTEEFDQDVPGLATAVRRMLTADVLRAFDDKIQADVIAAARPYEITQLDGEIDHANRWSAVRAMMGQIGYYNYITNTVAINPLTAVQLDESKNSNGTYLLPPFLPTVKPLIVEANKIAFGNVLVGDLGQYNVDIYKDFTLRVGWINDEFIHNKFAVLGELRYHSYISDNRKKAICYNALSEVVNQISGQGSI